MKQTTKEVSKRERPSAEKNWSKYSPVNPGKKWPMIWKGFRSSILTPRDTNTHFKLLHRGLNFKSHHDTRYTDTTCRLCHSAYEDETHCACCPALRHTWNKLASICEEGGDRVETNSHEFTLFGLAANGRLLQPAHAALHKLVWKFVWQISTAIR